MNFKQWIIDLFRDERGSTSIKPVIALIGTLFLCAVLTATSVNKDITPEDNVVNAVLVITAIGMGADTLDKFSFKKADTPVPPTE